LYAIPFYCHNLHTSADIFAYSEVFAYFCTLIKKLHFITTNFNFMQYYIIKDGQQVGPMNKESLLQYGLTPQSMVWCEGMTDWTQAANVPELMALLQPAPQYRNGNYPPEWYVIINDVQNGPYTLLQMQSMQLSPDTPVWKNGMANWTTVSMVPELAGSLPRQQPSFRQPGYQQQSMYDNSVKKSQNMTIAIIATVLGLCSCLGMVFGIIAITKVNSANTKYAHGDYEGGLKDDQNAKTMAIIGLVLDGIGLIVSVVQLIYS